MSIKRASELNPQTPPFVPRKIHISKENIPRDVLPLTFSQIPNSKEDILKELTSYIPHQISTSKDDTPEDSLLHGSLENLQYLPLLSDRQTRELVEKGCSKDSGSRYSKSNIIQGRAAEIRVSRGRNGRVGRYSDWGVGIGPYSDGEPGFSNPGSCGCSCHNTEIDTRVNVYAKKVEG